jgi:carbonic anhydrase/acetyltransferase-like protein (isoleucine patch superfamily)
VTIAPGSSVWFGAVIRSDLALIQIGRNTSVQDNAVIHVREGIETRIGDQVTMGHGAIVHGAQIEDTVLIGIGAIILDKARVGKGSIVGAGAVVTEGTQIPRRKKLHRTSAALLDKRTALTDSLCACGQTGYMRVGIPRSSKYCFNEAMEISLK